MKKYISILLCFVITLLCTAAFAKTVEIPVCYEKTFYELDASYVAEDDGWITWSNNRTQDCIISDNRAHIYLKSGSNATGLFASGRNLRMIYSKNLGEVFDVSGKYYHYENSLRIYFNAELSGNDYKSGFYMYIPNSNGVKLMYKPESGSDIELASWDTPTKYAQNFTVNPYSVSYNNGIARITLGSGGTMFDSGEINLSDLLSEVGIEEYNTSGFFGFGSSDANFVSLKSIAINGLRTIEVGEMKIISLSSKKGIVNENVIKLAFSGQVEKDTLLSNLSINDLSITDVVVSPDGYSADIYLEGMETGREYTLTVSENMTSIIEEYLPGDYSFSFTADEVLKSYEITSGPDMLYDDYRFENDFTYTGKITISPDSGYIYFNADKNSAGDIFGMRVSINAESICLEEGTDSASWVTLSESPADFAVGDTLYFNLTYGEGALSFSAVGAGSSAELCSDATYYTNGFVGVGGSSIKAENILVTAKEINAYEKVKIISSSAPFNGYAVYGKQSTPEVSVALNKTIDEILSAILYVDGKKMCDFEENDGVFAAVISGLLEGSHKASAVITDKYNTEYKIDSEYFCIGKGSFIPGGFTSGEQEITSLEEAAGKTVTASFDYSYDKDAIVVACLYDASGCVSDMVFSSGDGSAARVDVSIPGNAHGYTLKAFMCESFASPAPLSGTMILK